ncbi:MAG: DUF3592 domain-containing protein [Cytophagaceae bacterium]
MEKGILIFICLDAAITIFLFWKIIRGYFFMKEVITWETTEGKILDIIQIMRNNRLYQDPVVQFTTPSHKSIQFKSIRVKENVFSLDDKVEVLYNPFDPYKAIIKGYEDLRYREGIREIIFLIGFNILASVLYYLTVYLNF